MVRVMVAGSAASVTAAMDRGRHRRMWATLRGSVHRTRACRGAHQWSLHEGIGIITTLNVYIISSRRDWANRFLFPVRELSSGRPMICSIGACGHPLARDTVANEAGEIQLGDVKSWDAHYDNVWNVDATDVISSHVDIYKGRVARILWKLLHWPLNTRWAIPPTFPDSFDNR
jgi:hypothetical protein